MATQLVVFQVPNNAVYMAVDDFFYADLFRLVILEDVCIPLVRRRCGAASRPGTVRRPRAPGSAAPGPGHAAPGPWR